MGTWRANVFIAQSVIPRSLIYLVFGYLGQYSSSFVFLCSCYVPSTSMSSLLLKKVPSFAFVLAILFLNSLPFLNVYFMKVESKQGAIINRKG